MSTADPQVAAGHRVDHADAWWAVRGDIPLLDRVAYFDAAGVVPTPTSVRAAMREFGDEWVRDGVLDAFPVMEAQLARIRGLVAQLIGAAPSTVIPVATASDALNAVANAVAWQPGDNVVINASEYPSNFYPWFHLRRRGIDVRIAEGDATALPEHILELVDDRTRVVAVSHVAFVSGVRIAVEDLGVALADRDTLLVVDATQSVGAVRLDVDALGADVVVASGFKWMMGPMGTGFLYVRESVIDALQPSSVSWMSFTDRVSTIDVDVELAPDTRRFMTSGNLPYEALAGLAAAIDTQFQLGLDAIEARVLDLTGRLIGQLDDLGLHVRTPRRRESRAGIVTVDVADADAALVQLQDAGVHAVIRDDALRFSPHIYNTEDDIDRALAVLKELP